MIPFIFATIRVCVIVSDGFEPVEAFVPISYLKQAGAEVQLALVDNSSTLEVTDLYEHEHMATKRFTDIKDESYDAIVFPGGNGNVRYLASNELVIDFIKKHNEEKKILCAIGESTGILLAEGAKVMDGKNGCGYPGTDQLIADNGGTKLAHRVVYDSNVISSRGPGTSQEFALRIIKVLFDNDVAKKISDAAMITHDDYSIDDDEVKKYKRACAILAGSAALFFVLMVTLSITTYIFKGQRDNNRAFLPIVSNT